MIFLSMGLSQFLGFSTTPNPLASPTFGSLKGGELLKT